MANRKKSSTPKRWRMRRPQRLNAARAWIASGARVTVKTYSRWFRVDRHCAYLELVMLGVAISEADKRHATPSPPRPRREPKELPEEEWRLPDWVDYGGEPMFVVGLTSNGFPYGTTLSQMRELDPDYDWPADVDRSSPDDFLDDLEGRLRAMDAEELTQTLLAHAQRLPPRERDAFLEVFPPVTMRWEPWSDDRSVPF